MQERLRAILAEVDVAVAPLRTTVVFAHRQHQNAVLARDVTAALVARSDKALGTAIVLAVGDLAALGCVTPSERVGKGNVAGRASAARFAELSSIFCQLCLDYDLLVCVNSAERLWVQDCFYVLRNNEKEPLYDRKQVGLFVGVRVLVTRRPVGCCHAPDG